MMQREALPWLAVVRAWDLPATPLTQAGRLTAAALKWK